MISASSALNGVGMTSDEAAEVFRSMKVETTSKTPYSDATQVRRKITLQSARIRSCEWK